MKAAGRDTRIDRVARDKLLKGPAEGAPFQVEPRIAVVDQR